MRRDRRHLALVKAAKLLPEKSSSMLHDVDEALAVALLHLAVGGYRYEKTRLFDAAGPIDRQIEATLYEASEHELRPVEGLAVGELNEFVH
jgi:hypothetical protein